jgi:hypothetical protein
MNDHKSSLNPQDSVAWITFFSQWMLFCSFSMAHYSRS